MTNENGLWLRTRPEFLSLTRKILPTATAILWLRIAPSTLLTMLTVLGILATGCIPQHPVVGLKPESPSIKYEASDLLLLRLEGVKETHVDIVRPTFRWEQFPRVQDHKVIDQSNRLIGAVTYELRLWKVGKGFSDYYKYSWMYGRRDTDPGELVYSRQGIGQPEHTLETPLQPDSSYYWSVRAHFTLDGRRRATQWSQLLPSNTPVSEIQSTCLIPATFHLIHTP